MSLPSTPNLRDRDEQLRLKGWSSFAKFHFNVPENRKATKDREHLNITVKMGTFKALMSKDDAFSILSFQGIVRMLAVLFGLMVLQSIATIIYNLYFHPIRNIPGPRLWVAFPILKIYEQTKGRLDYKIRALHEELGDVVRLGPNEISFITPEAWKDIYGYGQGRAELPKWYPKGVGMSKEKIISSDWNDHARMRRALLPAFSDKALSLQEPLILVYVNLLIGKLRERADLGEVTDMVRWYNFTTFDLIADLAYGESLHGLEEGKSNVWLDSIKKMIKILPVLTVVEISPFLAMLFQLILGPKIRDSKIKHEEYCTALAMNRISKKENADRGDFMDFMLKSRGEKDGMTQKELIVNSDLLMVAGSETTSTLLSGVTFWLLKTPHALKRVTEEVRSAFANEEEISFREASSKLPYMLACLEEAFRMFPPVPLVLYRLTLPGPPTSIAGHLIPEKVGITSSEVTFVPD